MRLSTIAVCLLLASPSPVLACFEHDAEQTKWIHEMPPSSWGMARAGGDARRWDGALGMGLIGAGSGSIALVVASFRAFSRAAARGPVPPTRPAGGGDRESQEFPIQEPESESV